MLRRDLSFNRKQREMDDLNFGEKVDALVHLLGLRVYSLLRNPYVQAFLIW